MFFLQQLDGKSPVLDHAVGRGHLAIVATGAEKQGDERRNDHQPDGQGDHDFDQAHACLPAERRAPCDSCFSCSWGGRRQGRNLHHGRDHAPAQVVDAGRASAAVVGVLAASDRDRRGRGGDRREPLPRDGHQVWYRRRGFLRNLDRPPWPRPGWIPATR